MPELSVVIPTFNRPAELRECLEGYAGQTAARHRFEVVVVDDGSTADIASVVSSFRSPLDIRVERRAHLGAAAARNAAIALARAPLLILGEDDLRPLPSLVEYCLAFHAAHPGEAQAVLLYFTLDPRLGASPVLRYLGDRRMLAGFPLREGVHGWPYFYGGALSCKRSLFRFGEFDPAYGRLEDTELGLRLSRRVALRIAFERLPQATHIRDLDLDAAMQREYASAYHWFRLGQAIGEDPALRPIREGHPESYRTPERFIRSADELAGLFGAARQLEGGLAGQSPGLAEDGVAERFQMLFRLYDVAIAHAQASGWVDARERQPLGRPPGPRHGHDDDKASRAVAAPRTAPGPGGPPPAASDPHSFSSPLGLEALGALLATARKRLRRDPTVLDWTGRGLAALWPDRAIAAPPIPEGPLPYLDGTFDVVVIDARRPRDEARRVGRAVIALSPSGAVRVQWRGLVSAPAASSRPRAARPRLKGGGRTVLVCAPTFPDHDRASGSQDTLDRVDLFLKEGWRVSFAAQKPTAGGRYARLLEERGVEVLVGFDRDTERRVATGGFALAVFTYWFTAEAFAPTIRRLSPRTRIVIDSVDLHFLRQARERFLPERDDDPRGPGLGAADASDMARELNAYGMADAVWTVSAKEAALLAEIMGHAVSTEVIPVLEDAPPSRTPFAARRGLVFVGNFRHRPNVAAVRRLCFGILPRLPAACRAEHPVSIVGHGPTPEVVDAARRTPGVHLTGWVPSLAPYLDRARVALVPVPFGAGTKRKLVQALVAGTPAVASPAGVEGLGLRSGEHVLVASGEQEFADAVALLLRDERLWRHVSRAGRRHAVARHSPAAVRRHFRRAVRRVMKAPIARPSAEPAFLTPPPPSDAAPNAGVDAARDAALWRTGALQPGSRPDAVVLSSLDWRDEGFARPQHLSLRMAAHGHRVFYVQRPRHGGATRGLRMEAVAPHVVVVDLPVDGPRDFSRSGLQASEVAATLRALAELRSLLGIQEAFLLALAPAWGPVASVAGKRHGWPLVYDHREDHADVAADALFRESALVWASTPALARKARLRGARRARVIPDGVTPEDFEQPSLPPEGLRRLPRPVLGHFGAITDAFDVEMVAEAARLRPHWSFLLVGRAPDTDVGRLRSLHNVVLRPEQPYRLLPSYAQLFDLCLIPRRARAATPGTGSTSFFEYLSLGRPVVATPQAWLRPFGRRGLVAFARDGAELVAQAERVLARGGPRPEARRRAAARRHTWERRYQDLWPTVAAAFPLASLVMPTCENLAVTRRCLESLLRCTSWPRFEVLVVDNGSRDGTPEYVEGVGRRDARVRVLRNRRNLGFARAVNRGLRAARGDSLVILNNDVVFTPGWLGGLLTYLGDPGVGAVGPVTNRAGNEAQVEVDYPTAEGVEAFAARFTTARGGQALEVDRLAMFCMALTRGVYEEVGLLDVRFAVGLFEDDDYARRIRATGRRLLCVSDVFVHHVGHVSFNRLGAAEYERLFQENRARFEKKWKTRWTLAPQRARPLTSR